MCILWQKPGLIKKVKRAFIFLCNLSIFGNKQLQICLFFLKNGCTFVTPANNCYCMAGGR
ncbi:hypothetical protein BVG80_04495 [Sphingobacteriales bacterium TSM_CSM]|nr:hypothetical protein BVG80_04495 [Sphingobacteriales bacterium TSM_CSM]